MCSVLPPFAAEKPSRNSSLMEFSLQALLVRHEAYMADAEKERLDMMAQIEELESRKQELQKTNESLVTENRTLLDQLEAVNNAVAESDTRVTSLQATLHSAQQEMQRLSQLATRTERLERQLADFEREHEACQASLTLKVDEEKTATRRWQKSERALADMQGQLEKIEQEAKEERERHVEVVGRMERRCAVEKELTSAAGRLKGAAASKTTGRDGSGTNVVSHFVKDILQDNANLQMGIVELREMLQNSNEEVENLRHQLVLHQPLEEEEEEASRPALGNRKTSLNDELTRAASQELHVHHHYHAPSTPAATGNRNALRRPKKKRYGGLTPNHYTPPMSGRSTPRSSVSYHTPSSMSTILQQTTVSVPDSTPSNHRWSTYSNQTYQSQFSGPGSPQSTINRTSSIFDRVFSDGGQESSRPTTPDTEEPGSPIVIPTAHKKRPSGSGFRTISAPVVQRKGVTPGPSISSLDSIMDNSIEELPLKPKPNDHHAIAEEGEDNRHQSSSPAVESTSSEVTHTSEQTYFDINSSELYNRPLRRAASHESLLSISGMDIHTYQSRPKHKLLTQGGVSSGTVVSSAQAHAARPTIATQTESNGHSLLRGVAADQRLSSAPKKTITRKASGWIFGRWGATPAPAIAESSTSASTKSASIKSGSDRAKEDANATPKPPKLRSPGINQAGPIFGFPPEIKVHHPPVVKKLDQEELRNVLDEA